MLVTFRVKDIETRLHSVPAQIRPQELAALMRRLHTANSTIDADPGEFLAAPLNFEINANALAIAEFASCFDHRAEMIAIVEEAQFLGRMLRIEHPQCDAPITMRVSEHIALVGDMTMSSDLAAKVLTLLAAMQMNLANCPCRSLGQRSRITGLTRLSSRQESLRSSKASRSSPPPIVESNIRCSNGPHDYPDSSSRAATNRLNSSPCLTLDLQPASCRIDVEKGARHVAAAPFFHAAGVTPMPNSHVPGHSFREVAGNACLLPQARPPPSP